MIYILCLPVVCSLLNIPSEWWKLPLTTLLTEYSLEPVSPVYVQIIPNSIVDQTLPITAVFDGVVMHYLLM